MDIIDFDGLGGEEAYELLGLGLKEYNDACEAKLQELIDELGEGHGIDNAEVHGRYRRAFVPLMGYLPGRPTARQVEVLSPLIQAAAGQLDGVDFARMTNAVWDAVFHFLFHDIAWDGELLAQCETVKENVGALRLLYADLEQILMRLVFNLPGSFQTRFLAPLLTPELRAVHFVHKPTREHRFGDGLVVGGG